MIKHRVSKKLSVVFLVTMLSSGFCSVQVSASQPSGDFSFLVSPYNIILPCFYSALACRNTELPFAAAIPDIRRQVLQIMEEYRLLVDMPLDTLFCRFMDGYAFNTSNGETWQTWIFRDNPQVEAIAERLRAVKRRANEDHSEQMNSGERSLLEKVQAFVAGDVPYYYDNLLQEMNELNNEIAAIDEELNRIESLNEDINDSHCHKPSFEDLDKCIDCHLID